MGLLNLFKKKSLSQEKNLLEQHEKPDLHVHWNNIPDKMKDDVKAAIKETYKDNIDSVAFNGVENGIPYKYIYDFKKDASEYDKEDVGNKIINGMGVTFGRYERLSDFLVYYPKLKETWLEIDPNLEEHGICLLLSDCGKSKIITPEKEYYQLPMYDKCPSLVYGVQYDDNGTIWIHFPY